MKLNMCFKNIKNIQFSGQIFKICSHVNLFNKSCNLKLQLNLQSNFGLFNNILGLYKQKNKKSKKKKNLTKILKEIQFAALIMRYNYIFLLNII